METVTFDRLRYVPLHVKIYLLLGGSVNQFGWFFFGFGLMFVWLFALEVDMTGWFAFKGNLQTAPGTILLSAETNASSNEVPVYKHHYEFVYNDLEYQGVSYRTGGGLLDGRPVTIEFPEGRPERSRIQSMRTDLFGPFGLISLIFPAFGLCIIGHQFHKGLKAISLLQHGQHARGKLVAKQATRTEINERPVYKLTFEFKAADGRIC